MQETRPPTGRSNDVGLACPGSNAGEIPAAAGRIRVVVLGMASESRVDQEIEDLPARGFVEAPEVVAPARSGFSPGAAENSAVPRD